MTSLKPLCAVLLIVASSLAACATDRSKPASACPPLIEYDQATLDRAAAELEALPPQSTLEQLLADYKVTRDMLRACQ